MKDSIIEKSKVYVSGILSSLDNLFYHQLNHSIEVYERATYLGKKEKISREDLEMLQIASLFHDTGFIVQYDNNEPMGAQIAKNFLKQQHYPKEKILFIESLILATSPLYKTPKNILEAIIKDSDIDNLGRIDFFEKGGKVKEEIETIKKIELDDPSWEHTMLNLLKKTKFYTKTQIKERQGQKEKNIKKLTTILKKEHTK